MKVHFISIGGSAMHNLAIALSLKGVEVSGSDDEIFDPAKTRLAKYGLLPGKEGWFPEKISPAMDAVILGMHARMDNPELIKAKELGIKVYSYPEYLYEQSSQKKRIVIGGSHGKTTITAMILHVLQHAGIETDFMVGAQLSGFDVMVRLSETAPFMIIEGDEYLTSPIDLRPKFHLYKPHIALISGIAWDHINVFPTFENYVDQFRQFIEVIEPDGKLIYFVDDKHVLQLAQQARKDIELIPYSIPPFRIQNETTFVSIDDNVVPLQVFGKHNLANLEGAKQCCMQIGVSESLFYKAIQSFGGASKRLELVKKNENSAFYKDFAHSPSKLQASITAVKDQYPNRELTACLELHTFSSLNKDFLLQYKSSMDIADKAIVYFNPHTLAHKKLPQIHKTEIVDAFDKKDLLVFTDSSALCAYLERIKWNQKNLLMMSSGNFDGINWNQLADQLRF